MKQWKEMQKSRGNEKRKSTSTKDEKFLVKGWCLKTPN